MPKPLKSKTSSSTPQCVVVPSQTANSADRYKLICTRARALTRTYRSTDDYFRVATAPVTSNRQRLATRSTFVPDVTAFNELDKVRDKMLAVAVSTATVDRSYAELVRRCSYRMPLLVAMAAEQRSSERRLNHQRMKPETDCSKPMDPILDRGRGSLDTQSSRIPHSATGTSQTKSKTTSNRV